MREGVGIPSCPLPLPMLYKTAEGWLTERERDLLFSLSKGLERKVPTILNIGVEYGASLVCFLEGNANAFVYGMDLDTRKWKYQSPRVRLIQADSVEAFEWWGLTVDLLFIDGDHSYDGTLADMAYINTVRKGGIVAIHDCYSWENPGIPKEVCPDVNRAVEDYLKNTKYGLTEHPYVDSIRYFTLAHKGLYNKKAE